MGTITLLRGRFSAALKLIAAVSAIAGVILSAAASGDTFMGGRVVFMYFTIQSNLAIALISLAGLGLMLRKRQGGRVWMIIHLMGTVSITLTGMVFCFVLAPTISDGTWSIQNILTHVVVPAAAVLDFLVSAHYSAYRKRDVLWVIVPPLLYAVYAGIGYVQGWEFARGVHYPYFFLNWGSKAGAFGFCDELPFMGCVWWILCLLAFLVLVGLLYLFILRVIANLKGADRP